VKLNLLACDYDGTLARDGTVDDATYQALERAIASGRKLAMVTGRELNDLFTTFFRPELFEWIVAENGGTMYHPATKRKEILAEPPPPAFVDELKRRGVGPISVGDVIVATWEPHQDIVLQTIRDLNLELQVIFNKGAVMILPAGTNKASGLARALAEMSLSPHNVVAVGDAENDHSLLKFCESGAAVQNALPGLKEKADLILLNPHGAGVAELIDLLIRDEEQVIRASRKRHLFEFGTADDRKISFHTHQGNILIAGSSGGGKSTAATTMVEALSSLGYQICIIDPEGDYASFQDATVIGTSQHTPTGDELFSALRSSIGTVVFNLVGTPHTERPPEFLKALARIQELRAELGRPHWIVIDEAHHVLPAGSGQAPLVLPQKMTNSIFITLNPSEVFAGAMSPIETFIGIGDEAAGAMKEWARIAELPEPLIHETILERGQALLWRCAAEQAAIKVKVLPNKFVRQRHRKKYAEGELPEHRCFYFRGPQQKLNLRAYNLMMFVQLSEGVDDETWLYHLKNHDYSNWLRKAVKDDEVGDQVIPIENDPALDAAASREAVKKIIEQKYTLPAKPIPKKPE